MGTPPLPTRLERDDAAPTVTAFPDGSVDTFYDVSANGERVTSREAFADGVASGGVFTLRREAVEPGGHAVNLAQQADRLGDDVHTAGHLDDPAFADLAFETTSMGEPSTVSIYGFDDGDVLAVEPSAALEAWTLADLRDALGDGADEFLTADVVCCANWTTVEHLSDALRSLADAGVDGDWFLFDPASLGGRSDQDIADLFGALSRLTSSYDVVIAANPDEVGAMAGALDRPSDDTDAALAALREHAGVTGVVVHGESRAAVATAGGLASEQNFDVDPTRHTGGGDRFDAGLAHALGRGWSWTDALRLGNACASRYVATGETGTAEELAAFVRDHGDAE